ncbi:MAG: PhnD/SsuA/transferrin family substrate-binding protein [Caldilineales bacterium]|nr:PhnD/SsuA/transferrin family substrate-binding protein [Caldilineales bacterium]
MNDSSPLRFTSCQAPNADESCRRIAEFISGRMGRPGRFVSDIPWQERMQGVKRGEFHAAWICGAPYVKLAGLPSPAVRPLAAPVMSGERYQDRPVYFSDVVVRNDSRFLSFADLAGAVWAYNEPESHSGFGVVAYHLATSGRGWDFFGRVIESGAHEISLRMLLAGEIDASAIDSTVLETELRARPGLASEIHIIDTLGSSPVPPWVTPADLDEMTFLALRRQFTTLHRSQVGRAIMAESGIACFVAVNDADYEPIRRMMHIGKAAGQPPVTFRR